jgi:methyltransferase (TIGR00027 family)
MRTKGASGTASLVTLIRALAHGGLTQVRDFEDPTAFAMLTGRWQLVCRYLLWRARKPQFRQHLLTGKSGLGTDLVPLRTRVLDDAWHAASALGTRQLVLLGAGLDGRAYRLKDVGEAAVFEVDHPATQRLKRERAAALTSRARQHVFVPVDFERDSLAEALTAAGQRADVATFWIWEGVTPYLTRQAQETTLAAIASRSTAGSRLAMTYTQPPDPNDRARVMRQTMKMVRLAGEPFLGLMRRAQAEELLSGARFRSLEDTGVQDWQTKYVEGSSRPAVAYQQRIAVAEKVGTVAEVV